MIPSESLVVQSEGLVVGTTYITTMGTLLKFDLTNCVTIMQLYRTALNLANSTTGSLDLHHGSDIRIVMGTQVIYDGNGPFGWADGVRNKAVHEILQKLDGSEGFNIYITEAPRARQLWCATCHEKWNGQELMYRSSWRRWHCTRCRPDSSGKHLRNPNRHDLPAEQYRAGDKPPPT